MAVSLLEQSTAQFQASGNGAAFNWTGSFSLSSGTNTALVLEAVFGATGTGPTNFACTANGVSMYVAGSQNNANSTVVLFGLAPFTVAVSSFHLTWTIGTSSAEVMLQAQTLQGVLQTGSSQTFANFTGGTTSPSQAMTVTSSSDLIIAAWGTTAALGTPLAGTNLWSDNTHGAVINADGFMQSPAAAGSTTIGVTGGGGFQAIAGMDVQPATGGSTVTVISFSTPSMYPTRKVSVVAY